ncbi:hypothetical protein GCM10027589_15340 [Actinocorallia lasiicapitis]
MPDTAGAGTHRGGAAVLKDTLWLTDAEHWSSPLRTKQTSGFGVHGGKDGPAGGVWLFDRDAFDVAAERDLVPLGPAVYARSTPVAGVLDPAAKTLDPEHGTYFYFASNPVWRTGPGAVFRYITSGGGGWGDPHARDPELVRQGVRDGYLTIDGAARDYGVVISGDPEADPEGLLVDHLATEERRAQRP